MVGAGETYVPAFALAAGLGDLAAGLVATVPLLLGSLLQLAAPRWAARGGSLRRWVVACSVVQAACFLPLAAAAVAGGIPAVALFAVMTLYWGSGLATGPAWVTWIETLVPRAVRARYFGRRGILTSGVLLAAILGAGAVLEASAGEGGAVGGFAVLFLAAAAGRAASARWLALHREPWTPACRPVGAGEVVRGLRRTPAGRLIAAVVAVQAGLFVAVPFFTPYVLGPLGFSYAAYTLLVAAAFLARMVANPLLAGVADRHGPRALLVAAGVGLVPLAALWTAVDGLLPLVLLQVAGGVLSAAWELATLMLFFETMPREERLGVLTWFNLANAAALAGGSLAGGALLEAAGGGREAFALVFLASTALRVVCVPILLRVPAAPRPFRSPALPVLIQSGEARGGGPEQRR